MVAGLFHQLAFGRLQRRFALIQLAGGQLPQIGAGRQAILSHQKNAFAMVYRQHHCRALVLHDAPANFKAAWVHGVVFGDGKKPAVVFLY